jgi:hypothetical protein
MKGEEAFLKELFEAGRATAARRQEMAPDDGGLASADPPQA